MGREKACVFPIAHFFVFSLKEALTVPEEVDRQGPFRRDHAGLLRRVFSIAAPGTEAHFFFFSLKVSLLRDPAAGDQGIALAILCSPFSLAPVHQMRTESHLKDREVEKERSIERQRKRVKCLSSNDPREVYKEKRRSLPGFFLLSITKFDAAPTIMFREKFSGIILATNQTSRAYTKSMKLGVKTKEKENRKKEKGKENSAPDGDGDSQPASQPDRERAMLSANSVSVVVCV